MKYGELMMKLRKDGPCQVYLLSGEESYYIDKARERILAALFPAGAATMQDALQKLGADTEVDALLAQIESAPFFADKNVILCPGEHFFKAKKGGSEAEKKPAHGKKKTSPEDRLAAAMADMPSYSYVIFELREKADKRRKLYKAVSECGAVLESEAVRPWTIGDWLRDKLLEINKELDREAYAYFTGAVGMMQQISLSYLDKEFDKLALYTKERRLTKTDLLQVFSSIPEVSGFAMVDAVNARDVKKALQLLQRQIDDGVYLPLILGLLVRQVRQLWQVKSLMDKGLRGRQLAGPLELNPFIAEKTAKASQVFTEAALKKAFLALAEADYQLKTGQGGSELLANVIIGLCRK